MKNIFILLFIVGISFQTNAQQFADSNYNPPVLNPEYKKNKGPVIFIDEGHHNFHTREGRYSVFAKLIEKDGYQTRSYTGLFEKYRLNKGKILVISNALNIANTQHWHLPTPSAFTETEIETVREWVYHGGSLFLIADHMPMAGAATALAKAFQFEFSNGFALDTVLSGPAIFTLKDQTLAESILTTGRNNTETVKQVASFTGQAFKIPADAKPILVFNNRYTNLLPDTAWVFNKHTPSHSAEGWAQGAFKEYGKGRVVVFGEAAMFTAQLAGPQHMKAGMNAEVAKENYQLLLNIIHWLDGKL